MNENYNIPNDKIIYCPRCREGSRNNNNYCVNCGSPINLPPSDIQINTEINQPNKKNKLSVPHIVLTILAGIISFFLFLSIHLEMIRIIIIITALASLFNKKTRLYGLTFLFCLVGIVLGIGLIIYIIMAIFQPQLIGINFAV